MNEIIKIQSYGGLEVIDARMLHKKLESKQEFANWIKNRLSDFDEGIDYFTDDKIINRKNGVRGASKQIDYLLTIDTAKHLCMLERNHIGKAIRQYFIDFEKSIKNYLSDPNIKNYIDSIVYRTVKYHLEKLNPKPNVFQVKSYNRQKWLDDNQRRIDAFFDFVEKRINGQM